MTDHLEFGGYQRELSIEQSYLTLIPGARAMATAWSSINDSRPCDQRPRHRRSAASSSSLRFRPRFELVEDRTLLSTFSVTNTADSGPGSLRQAILDSNAATAATNTIDFAIPGTGVQTIVPVAPLPAITQRC